VTTAEQVASASEARFPRSWRQRWLLVPLVRLLRPWFRPRVHGLERVPADQPVLYLGKHPRTFLYLEVMLLGLLTFWDTHRPPFRPMEKRGTSLHRAPILGWIRRHVGTIEATEEEAIRAASGGESLLLFPGGPRELHGPPDRIDWEGRLGFARIAARAGLPVVPIAIIGADRQHPWAIRLGERHTLWLPPFPLPVRFDFWFGAPMAPPPPEDAAAVAAFARAVARATQALLDRGVAARGLAAGGEAERSGGRAA
jgi:1-acyl-sn-glycerol-3-phosphate acyltransferase